LETTVFRPRVIAALALLTAVVSAPNLSSAQGGPPPGPQGAAPQPSFEIRGKITDTSGKAIPRASVTLRPKGGTVTIAGAIAKDDGSFVVPNLRPGTFTIRVVFIGFAPVIQDITIKPDTPVLDLGVARLAPVAVQLDAMSIKEEKATVITEPDKSAYRAKDVAPGAANASEVLENTPQVQVDQDGKVSLRGNENVVVQINGRPTPMRGTQLSSFLKSLPANTIDRIEVIPNPSAKYDPEGMAGIINVALKSNVDLGLSGSVNSAISTKDRWNGAGNVGYQAGKWTTFVSGGVVSDARNPEGINDRDRYNAANALLSSTNQDLLFSPRNNGQNLNATVDYKANARDVLSNALMLNKRGMKENMMTAYEELDGSGATLATYARPRNMKASGWTADYDLAFKRTLKPREHELSTEWRFNRSEDDDNTLQSVLPTTSSTSYTDGKFEVNTQSFTSITGQLDYMKASTKGRRKLETGWKSNLRGMNKDYDVTVDATGGGTWTVAPESNVLSFDEGVHAVYGVFSQSVKKWDLQAGLRGEYATRDFTMQGTKYPYDYFSAFPSAVALYNLGPSMQGKASYSRRIRRPGTQELNPFPVWFDANNVFFGKPDIAPEYTDSYDFGLTKTGSKGMIQLSPYFRHTTNIIRIDINTMDTVDSREVTSISFRNLATSNSFGTDFTSQYRRSAKFAMLTNLGVFKQVTDGGSTSAVGSDAIGWMGRVNVSSELSSKLMAQVVYNYRAAVKIEKGEMGRQHAANLAFRYKLNGDKESIMFRVNDPFATMRFRVLAGDDKVIQLTERNPHVRFFFIGYQRNFGKPPKVRQVAPEATTGGSVGFGGPPGA
jgi:outer membrane receptor protein involved in Fe transport